jgi:hypothetical protein
MDINVDSQSEKKIMKSEIVMVTESAKAVRCDGQMDKNFQTLCTFLQKFPILFTDYNQYDIYPSFAYSFHTQGCAML